ncbi:MAG: NBR1-Ig-like domain-containing protein [Myxococcaceae bacterium]
MRARALLLIAAAVWGCGPGTVTPLDDAPAGVDGGVVADGGAQVDAGPPDSGSPAIDGGTDAGAPLYNASEYLSQSAPSSVKAGTTFEVRVTMRNTGTTTWSFAASKGHYLGSEGPRDNSTWGTNRIYLPAGVSVGPGESHTFIGSLTAPGTVGSYTMQWQMLQDAVEWFGAATPQTAITVERVGPPAGSTAKQIVADYRNTYGTPMTDAELIACLRDIAPALNAEGIAGGPFGVLVKTGGRNCNGYSCDIICSGQGAQQRQWDVFIASETDALPAWNEAQTIAIRVCEIL